jgi:hypothetical protein
LTQGKREFDVRITEEVTARIITESIARYLNDQVGSGLQEKLRRFWGIQQSRQANSLDDPEEVRY